MPRTCERAASQPAAEDRPTTPSPAPNIAGHTDDDTNNRRHPSIPVPVDTIQSAADLLGGQRERERQAYLHGFKAGYQVGYDAANEDWWIALAPARQAAARAARNPTHAELATRRWEPGGREHFADPRPGDYPGQGGDAS